MDTPWRIELLGALRVQRGAVVITRCATARVAALLARLALFPAQPHPREKLANLLWPEADPEAGRNRLRVAVASLRRQLEPPDVAPGSVLAADRSFVRLNPASFTCDVAEFEEALTRASRSSTPDQRREALDRALDLFGGELLPGFYDDWIVDERERLNALYEEAQGWCESVTLGSALPDRRPGVGTERAAVRGLPLQGTRFFGRGDEFARLSALLADPAVRLVTLSGPGGAGKTRLALEAARSAPPHVPVCFVPLADLRDVGLIPAAMAGALGLAPSPDGDPLDQVVDALAEGPPALFVLDNLEHLVERGAPLVLSLLTRVPTLTCLVTSRRRLGLPGERELPLGPLALPPPAGTAAQIAASDAARLFVDRAQAARPDFQVTARNAPDVAALCRELEGLPLALELAAAWAGAMGVAEMRQRLTQRFTWLASRRGDKGARHGSLWAALAWSYDLLPSSLQRFFAQLSVFRGGYTVEAAEAVCEEPQALELLTQLRERSLALAEEGPDGLRFRLLESVREFAGEQLSPGERADLAARHRDFFLAQAEGAEPRLTGAEAPTWLAYLGAERDNLRAALDECLGDDAPEAAQAGMRLAAALGRFWQARGELSEGRERLRTALTRPQAQGLNEARAWALRWSALLAYFQGDYAAARAEAEEARALFDSLGEKRGGGWARVVLGMVAACRGMPAEARPEFEAALTLFRAVGDARGVSLTLNNLGGVLMGLGELADAEPLFEEALARLRATGNWPSTVIMLTNLGTLAFYRGDLAMARRRLEESLTLRTQAGIRGDQSGYALAVLAAVALAEGQRAEAHTYLTEGLTACREGDDKASATNLLEIWGRLHLAEGRPDRAARALGAAARLRREAGVPREPVDLSHHEADVAAARAALGQKAFAAWAGGEALGWEQAVDEALGAQARRTP